VVGYISAFRRPIEKGTLVIWQTMVSPPYRGRRLAVRMLDWLADPSCRFVETIASPSNTAYDRFVKAFARNRSSKIEYFPYLTSEIEYLYRIGPL
jgi:hypothetical protein